MKTMVNVGEIKPHDDAAAVAVAVPAVAAAVGAARTRGGAAMTATITAAVTTAAMTAQPNGVADRAIATPSAVDEAPTATDAPPAAVACVIRMQ